MKNKICLASSNTGKIDEFNIILKDSNFEIISQTSFANMIDAEETASTYIENAIIKARNCAKITGIPSIADDSGLEVHALNGEPGIISARYAGNNNKNDNANIEKLLKNMEGITDRSAMFRSVIVFLRYENDPAPIISQGVWKGSITHKKVGTEGFGYDPIFWVDEYQKTAAQLTKDIKNKISHRFKALQDFKDKILDI